MPSCSLCVLCASVVPPRSIIVESPHRLFLTLPPCQPLAHPRSIIYVPIGNPANTKTQPKSSHWRKRPEMSGNDRESENFQPASPSKYAPELKPCP